jgi:hypothetical protein
MSGLVTHKINIAQVLAASGQITDIEIGTLIVGPVSIQQLGLEGTSFDLASGSALLQNVQVILQLQFTLDWWYNLWFASGSGSDNLGSLYFAVNVGNVTVPSLQNIPLSIPNLTASNVTANVPAITNLDLGGGSFDGVTVTNTTIPANGFQLGGLGLGAVTIANLEVPQITVAAVAVDKFSPTANVVIPSVELGQISLPAANAANIQTTSPIAFDADASVRSLNVPLGIFGVNIIITPIAHISIGSILLSGVSVSGSVQQGTIQNVQLPVNIQGINLKSINIGEINVNNITL